MAKSLQEQLLAAGLADEKKAKQIREEKRKAKKLRKQQKAQPSESEQARQRAQQALAEKAARDREINRRYQTEVERRALQAQVRQMVETQGFDRRDGEIPYNFVVDKKVKKILVTARLRDQLAGGRAAIVELDGAFHVVPADTAEKIRQRDAEVRVIQHQPQATDGEDPYGDFPIPDDLMW